MQRFAYVVIFSSRILENKQESHQSRNEYRTRLTASIECIRYLLYQGLAFRGHDESEDSNNQGNFLTLLRFHAHHNEDVRAVVLENAPENLKLISPMFQKEIVNAIAIEIVNFIIRDIGDGFFSILIDESRDISIKEQMAIVLRYVKNGSVIERFIGMVHVTDTTALSLKMAIDNVFSTHGLSISRLRGQGYDRARNMQGEFNGLKPLILKENEFVFYVHYLTHQIQLALVVVAKNHGYIFTFFIFVANVVNVVGASCKCRDHMLREKQIAEVIDGFNKGELTSGQGLNQSTSLVHAGDTRWGSHYGTLISLITLFSSVIAVLEFIEKGLKSDQRGEASILLGSIQSFNFVFNLHLMKTLLDMTNELSKALQRKIKIS
ncbi:uncharacterized protein LOC132277724 [Cornus florida]|uniref:uncharacterized protein LOC132277724 n=1 Tax=Cornus florida TaxID=4283 RepID=UPI0028A09CD3|nr:uncharacterized protein LOC132277724 [Cornus florida]